MYGFDLTAAQARGLLASCRAEVNEIVSGFGPAAADFFYHAVDGEFRGDRRRGSSPSIGCTCRGACGVSRIRTVSSMTRRGGRGIVNCAASSVHRPDAARTAELLARTQAFRVRLDT